MSRLSETRRQVRKQKITNLIANMKESYRQIDVKLVDFISLLDEYGFFSNLESVDIDYALEYTLSLPTLEAHGIKVGIDGVYNGTARIGIDPAYCFNKTGDCSILAYFPMGKREYGRLVKLFQKLIDNKSNYNIWRKKARTCWYGSYITFGR